MSNTISMQTETVQAAVDTLRRGSRYFNRLVLQINLHYRILSATWLGDRGEEYSTQLRRMCRLLEERTSELEIMAERLQNEVLEWEAMDKTPGQPAKRFPAVVAALLSGAGINATGGEVLGAATSIYDQMSWADKFALQQELAKKIAEIKAKYGLTGSDGEIAAMYADLEKQITELEEKRRQAQENADRWYNKILPDIPLEGDSEDGVPWRVKADDYEDEIKGYDAELAQLRAKREDLAGLTDLINQQQSLEGNIQKGIPLDGPSESHQLFKEPQCTWYASGKRNVPFRGNAATWNDHPEEGFEVGSIPVKGSVAVFEADKIHTSENSLVSDPICGHVAIVEDVVKNSDGTYMVKVSEGNWDEKAISERTISISVGESGATYKGVETNFIYDKK